MNDFVDEVDGADDEAAVAAPNAGLVMRQEWLERAVKAGMNGVVAGWSAIPGPDHHLGLDLAAHCGSVGLSVMRNYGGVPRDVAVVIDALLEVIVVDAMARQVRASKLEQWLKVESLAVLAEVPRAVAVPVWKLRRVQEMGLIQGLVKLEQGWDWQATAVLGMVLELERLDSQSAARPESSGEEEEVEKEEEEERR
jgi:hypothetical protein